MRGLFIFSILLVSSSVFALPISQIEREIANSQVAKVITPHEPRENIEALFTLNPSAIGLVELEYSGRPITIGFHALGSVLEADVARLGARAETITGQDAKRLYEKVKERLREERFEIAKIKVDPAQMNRMVLQWLDGATLVSTTYDAVKTAYQNYDIVPMGYDLILFNGLRATVRIDYDTEQNRVEVDLVDKKGITNIYKFEDRKADLVSMILSQHANAIRKEFMSPATVDAVIQNNLRMKKASSSTGGFFSRWINLPDTTTVPTRLARFSVFSVAELQRLGHPSCDAVLSQTR